eukprot:TRINITY_DN211_c0_g2_i11.p1 TRINITY_DN211_c0_g2~~TRINITY_DN211_c0_g2_i11.p1  ORF type:complete len:226 (-),score=21.27 TRINITY_DN211_c0_g2_i11:573-1250(-)
MQLNMHSHKRVSLSDAEMSSRLFQLADYITHNYATLKSTATLYSNSYNPGSMTHFQPYAQAPASFIPESWHGEYLSPSTITYHTTSLVRPTPLKASHSSSASANLWKSTNQSNSVDAVPIVRNIPVDKIKRKADQVSTEEHTLPSVDFAHSASSSGSDVSEDEHSENVPKKRRGNLPRVATDKLKSWLQNHTSFPYPSEDEKFELVRLTDLSLGQVNNWFINARR